MDKAQLREAVKSELAAFDAEYIKSSDEAIFERLIQLPELKSAERVFLYFSIGREVSTSALIAYCRREGIPYALPRTHKKGRMDFCIADGSFEAVSKAPFGIPEPPLTAKAAIPCERDVIIVPALCYDEALFRLGHGAGYYDRVLARTSAYTIGLCRERLVFPNVPREAHDIPVSALVTEIKVRNRQAAPQIAIN